MKLFDKILSISLVIYLIWICYYRLFADQKNIVIIQLYFLFEGVTFFIVLLRLFVEKWAPIVMVKSRYIIFVMLIFKFFQIIYRVFKITPDTKIYIESNNNLIWSFIGVVLILCLLCYPLVIKYFKKWVKN